MKISLKACNDTPYKEHPDVVVRTIAVVNNLAALYIKTGAHNKAMKYIKSYLKLTSNNLDKAISYSNMCKIYFLMNDTPNALQASRLCYDSIKEEADIITRERIYNPPQMINGSALQQFQNKIQLISFLYLNCGLALERGKKVDESKEVFKKGYTFSVSMLGEYNLNTNKFLPKISQQKKGKINN